MAKVETFPWDVIDHWETDEDQLSYLKVVMESDEEEDGPEFVALALVDIARARGILPELEEALRLRASARYNG